VSQLMSSADTAPLKTAETRGTGRVLMRSEVDFVSVAKQTAGSVGGLGNPSSARAAKLRFANAG